MLYGCEHFTVQSASFLCLLHWWFTLDRRIDHICIYSAAKRTQIFGRMIVIIPTSSFLLLLLFSTNHNWSVQAFQRYDITTMRRTSSSSSSYHSNDWWKNNKSHPNHEKRNPYYYYRDFVTTPSAAASARKKSLFSSTTDGDQQQQQQQQQQKQQQDDWSCTVLDNEDEYCFLNDVNAGGDDNDNNNNNNATPLNRNMDSIWYCHGDDCQLVELDVVAVACDASASTSTTTSNMNGDKLMDNDQEDEESLSSMFSSSRFWDKALQSKPILLSTLAFGTYDPMANLFSSIIQTLQGAQTWVAVDGGAYQAKIIAPAINGVVVPAIALLFANMIAITINTLKQRQLAIQLAMHMEAVQLRILSTCLDGDEHNSGVVVRVLLPPAVPKRAEDHTSDLQPEDEQRPQQDDSILSPSSLSILSKPHLQVEQVSASIELSVSKCQQYLWQYSSRLLSEAHENVQVNQIAMESELTGVVNELHRLVVTTAAMTTGGAIDDDDEEEEEEEVTNHLSSYQLSPNVWNQAMQACQLLTEQRAKRITALQSTFPPLHFAVLTALGGSILLAFLMETNQDILVFLNAIQLRLLWSILVGTLSVLGLVCYDLSHPFRGSYKISKRSSMMDQLSTIRQGLFLNLIQRQEQVRKMQARTTPTTTMNKSPSTADGNGTMVTNGANDKGDSRS